MTQDQAHLDALRAKARLRIAVESELRALESEPMHVYKSFEELWAAAMALGKAKDAASKSTVSAA